MNHKEEISQAEYEKDIKTISRCVGRFVGRYPWTSGLREDMVSQLLVEYTKFKHREDNEVGSVYSYINNFAFGYLSTFTHRQFGSITLPYDFDGPFPRYQVLGTKTETDNGEKSSQDDWILKEVAEQKEQITTPEEELSKYELLLKALKDLPQEYADVLIHRYGIFGTKEKSIAETAAELKITKDRVKTRERVGLARAKKILAEC